MFVYDSAYKTWNNNHYYGGYSLFVQSYTEPTDPFD